MHKPKSTHIIILYYDYGNERTKGSNSVGSLNIPIIFVLHHSKSNMWLIYTNMQHNYVFIQHRKIACQHDIYHMQHFCYNVINLIEICAWFKRVLEHVFSIDKNVISARGGVGGYGPRQVCGGAGGLGRIRIEAGILHGQPSSQAGVVSVHQIQRKIIVRHPTNEFLMINFLNMAWVFCIFLYW